jgi:hypothetical protein
MWDNIKNNHSTIAMKLQRKLLYELGSTDIYKNPLVRQLHTFVTVKPDATTATKQGSCFIIHW